MQGARITVPAVLSNGSLAARCPYCDEEVRFSHPCEHFSASITTGGFPHAEFSRRTARLGIARPVRMALIGVVAFYLLAGTAVLGMTAYAQDSNDPHPRIDTLAGQIADMRERIARVETTVQYQMATAGGVGLLLLERLLGYVKKR